MRGSSDAPTATRCDGGGGGRQDPSAPRPPPRSLDAATRLRGGAAPEGRAVNDPRSARRPALGRGLSALIPAPGGPSQTALAEPPRSGILVIAIERIHPEKEQPRKRFDGTALDELAASIREKGLLQPILVRKGEDGYRIVAGERRWRAAQRAGLHEVPAIVREMGDAAAFEAALVENLQREDLDPLETALAYQRLCEEGGLTQEEAAARVGKDRATVANVMRLLKLPPEIREAVAAGKLDMGHARALLGAPNETVMLSIGQLAVKGQLSVRDVERLVRQARRPGGAKPAGPSPEVRHAEEALARALGARVRVQARRGKGTIEIPFASHEEFTRLFDLLQRRAKE